MQLSLLLGFAAATLGQTGVVPSVVGGEDRHFVARAHSTYLVLFNSSKGQMLASNSHRVLEAGDGSKLIMSCEHCQSDDVMAKYLDKLWQESSQHAYSMCYTAKGNGKVCSCALIYIKERVSAKPAKPHPRPNNRHQPA